MILKNNIGSILLIDLRGTVKKFIHDDIGIEAFLKPGENIDSLINQGELEREKRFISELQKQKVAFGWVFNLNINEQSNLFSFSGMSMEGDYLLFIEQSVQESEYEQRVEVNEAMFDDLSQLNNELINFKRELDRKNAKLLVLNSALEKEISERKLIEEAQKISELRYKSLFEHSPISLWEEDFSGIKNLIDNLRVQGVSDFDAYFTQHPEVVMECTALVKVIDVNNATLEMFDADDKEIIRKNVSLFYFYNSFDQFRDELVQIAGGALFYSSELKKETITGEKIVVSMNWSALPGYENDLSKVIVSMVDITAKHELETVLQFQGTHDILSGLYNRLYFETEMERLQQGRQFPISIIMMDVDRLKQVNDTMGHSSGDDLLRNASMLLKKAFRREDMVARIGGDEFVAVLPRTDMDLANIVIIRLKAIIKDYNQNSLGGQNLSISIGVACGSHGTKLNEILKQADQAMYLDKEGKKRLL
jgi:diguanylate cyclase (GGDEF)-like protein